MYLSLCSFLLSLCKNFSRDLSSFLIVAAVVLILFVCLFLAVPGHCCCLEFLLLWRVGVLYQLQSTDSRASVVATRQLRSCDSWALEHSSVAMAHRLSCSVACGILPDQGSDLCVLHWQAYSFPLSHQGCSHPILRVGFLENNWKMRKCLLLTQLLALL